MCSGLLSSLVWQAPQIICGTLPSPSPAEKNDAKTRLSPRDDHNGSDDLDDDDDDDRNDENDTLAYSSHGWVTDDGQDSLLFSPSLHG